MPMMFINIYMKILYWHVENIEILQKDAGIYIYIYDVELLSFLSFKNMMQLPLRNTLLSHCY